MSKRVKGDALLELFGRALNKKFTMFNLSVYIEDDGVLHFHQVTNIEPHRGREFLVKAAQPNAKIEQVARFVSRDGQIQILKPAAAQEQIDKDAAAVKAPLDLRPMAEKRADLTIVRSGQAGLPELQPRIGKKIFVNGQWITV